MKYLKYSLWLLLLLLLLLLLQEEETDPNTLSKYSMLFHMQEVDQLPDWEKTLSFATTAFVEITIRQCRDTD